MGPYRAWNHFWIADQASTKLQLGRKFAGSNRDPVNDMIDQPQPLLTICLNIINHYC